MRPKLLIYASGSADGGGSGFENLVRSVGQGRLNAEIVGVVSNYFNGGVWRRADALQVPFMFFPKPWTAEQYQRIAEESQADFFALSGWLKLVRGLDSNTRFNSQTVFNIHPGPLPDYGGLGMHGHFVHEAVLKAGIRESEVTMHFVTEEYDQGPVFLRSPVRIEEGDTSESLGKRVNVREHALQPEVTDLVVNGAIKWDGKNPKSLILPADYDIGRTA